MGKSTPGPRELQLRAMREANYATAERKAGPKKATTARKKKRPRRG